MNAIEIFAAGAWSGMCITLLAVSYGYRLRKQAKP